MPLLKNIRIRNFLAFRDDFVDIRLGNSALLIGPNNSGKSAVLYALKVFFDHSYGLYEKDLNYTTFRSRDPNFSTAEISLTFDLDVVRKNVLRTTLKKAFGSPLQITKRMTLQPKKGNVIEFLVEGPKNNQTVALSEFPISSDETTMRVWELINAVNPVYIHPQLGAGLLREAQEKLKRRLLDHWARGPAIKRSSEKLGKDYSNYTADASKWLSEIVTKKVNRVLPEAKVTVNLPVSVEELIKIGDISFQPSSTLPDLSISSQGTGVQQLLLYYAHFVIDTDKAVARNQEYHPVWLLEEPESFLHADMIAKLSRHINSEEWLDLTQVVTTTHSGVYLANSSNDKREISWCLIESGQASRQVQSNSSSDHDIQVFSRAIGDPLLPVYFKAGVTDPRLFLEDKRREWAEVLRDAGIPVQEGLGGESEVQRYLNALMPLPYQNVTFLIDGDGPGLALFESYKNSGEVRTTPSGLQCLSLQNGTKLVCLPEGKRSEDVMSGWVGLLENVVNFCFENNRVKLDHEQIPAYLNRVMSGLQSSYQDKEFESRDEMLGVVRRNKAVKDQFWRNLSDYNAELGGDFAHDLKEILHGSQVD